MPCKVLVTARAFTRYPGPHTKLLLDAGCAIIASEEDRPLSPAELRPLVSEADGIIAGVDYFTADVIAAAPRLKVISRHGVGFDGVDLAAATRAGVVVSNTPGANQIAVAELTVGLMFCLARHIPAMIDVARAGGWSRIPGIELAGKTAGIVGLGRIGKSVATRLRAMEMELVAYDVFQDVAWAQQNGVTFVSLAELLRRADFVCLHAAATGGGPLIGEPELRLLKPTAYLINVARGSLVDEDALYRALREGRLAGAALDVFVKEPPLGSPLLQLDNVLPTPHLAGNSREGMANMALMAAQNALQVLRGERCPCVVNPEVYAVKKP